MCLHTVRSSMNYLIVLIFKINIQIAETPLDPTLDKDIKDEDPTLLLWKSKLTDAACCNEKT